MTMHPFAYLRAALLVALGAMQLAIGADAVARTMVYISNADSRDIHVLEMNEQDGSSTLVEKIAVTGMVMPMAVSPDRKHLYASLRSEPYSVSTFAIGRRGRLTLMETVPLADNMANLDTDHSGRFLLAASYSGNKISVNAVRPQGTVDPKPLAVLPTGKNAHAIHADPSNRFVFVTNLGDDQILQYRFDPVTGKLTPNSPAAVATNKGAGPRHLVFHPNRRLVFSTNELDGTVNTYRLDDAAGTLTLVGSTSVMPPGFNGGAPATADLHLSPDGKFLYTSERTSNTLAAFAVRADTGKLTLIAHYPTEQQPRAFNIDPSGRYLLAVGQMSGRLSSYGIDRSTGTLRKLSDQAVGSNPNWVEIVALPD